MAREVLRVVEQMPRDAVAPLNVGVGILTWEGLDNLVIPPIRGAHAVAVDRGLAALADGVGARPVERCGRVQRLTACSRLYTRERVRADGRLRERGVHATARSRRGRASVPPMAGETHVMRRVSAQLGR